MGAWVVHTHTRDVSRPRISSLNVRSGGQLDAVTTCARRPLRFIIPSRLEEAVRQSGFSVWEILHNNSWSRCSSAGVNKSHMPPWSSCFTSDDMYMCFHLVSNVTLCEEIQQEMVALFLQVVAQKVLERLAGCIVLVVEWQCLLLQRKCWFFKVPLQRVLVYLWTFFYRAFCASRRSKIWGSLVILQRLGESLSLLLREGCGLKGFGFGYLIQLACKVLQCDCGFVLVSSDNKLMLWAKLASVCMGSKARSPVCGFWQRPTHRSQLGSCSLSNCDLFLNLTQ